MRTCASAATNAFLPALNKPSLERQGIVMVFWIVYALAVVYVFPPALPTASS